MPAIAFITAGNKRVPIHVMTKRDLIDLLKPFDDSERITINGRPIDKVKRSCEPGEIDIIST